MGLVLCSAARKGVCVGGCYVREGVYVGGGMLREKGCVCGGGGCH